MRITAVFFVYLLSCLAIAALLSVPLMETGWLEIEPHRVMSRLAQVVILLGIWPLLWVMQLANRDALGYGAPSRELRQAVARGWILGVLILLGLVAFLLALGVRAPDPDPPSWGSVVAKAIQALVGGLMIGLLEETFFRGALYTALRRAGGLWSAMAWSALLYAAVHFMKPSALPAGEAFDWLAAVAVFGHALIDLFQWENVDSLVALIAVGIFLAMVRERTGHIGWCIGLHAGWVLVIQVSRKLTDGNDASPLSFLAGAYDGTIGWLAAIWIGVLALVYWAVSGRRSA